MGLPPPGNGGHDEYQGAAANPAIALWLQSTRPEGRLAELGSFGTMEHLLANVRSAFAGTARPEHFTNYNHCEECHEHDEILRKHTPDTISLDELGNPGWDPICFILPEGFLYYLPGLIRLADAAPHDYMDQLLFHLNYDRIQYLSARQRLAVLEWLNAMDGEYNLSAGDSPTAYQMQMAVQQLRA